MKPKLYLFLVLLFATFQVGISFRQVDIYPFNSYQMFSKNWQNGRVIAGLEASIDGKKQKPLFEHIDIPFFQANKIYLLTYYETQNKNLKSSLCHHLRTQTGAKSIELYGVMKRFTRNSIGHVETDYDFNEKAWSCFN